VSRVLFFLLALAGCSGTYRYDNSGDLRHLASRDVLRLAWQRRLIDPAILDFRPQEWSRPAIDALGVVYIGSSAGKFFALDHHHGRVRWSLGTNGAISSTPLVVEELDLVFFGSDDGNLYAVHRHSGKVSWTYATQGTINHQPVYENGLLLFTSNEDRLYAIDARSGKWRWQYDREAPEGFTIHGYAGVLVKGGVAYSGFSDGMLVALKAGTGDVVWTRSLGQNKTRFMDVDATPVDGGDVLFVTSYAGGIFAIRPDDGSVRWHYPLEGAMQISLHRDRLYVATANDGVVMLGREGRPEWKQTLAMGVPAPPVVLGPSLFITGTESGLYIASAKSGRLLQYFDTADGISAAASIRHKRLVVLGNDGWLYSFRVVL
jgi:outer membrane protein assembly factor BamB